MKRIAILPNRTKRGCDQELRRLTAWLKRRGVEPLVPAPDAGWSGDRERGPAFTHRELREVDLLVVLGGDGTLLAAARMIYPLRVPILGVNFGSLGFLADVNVEGMLPAMERILAGQWRREPRMMLRASTADPEGRELERVYGLNDLVLREAGGRATLLEATLSGRKLGEFRADGVIIATPTGSTAYSLSAGGPIVQPTLHALIATPICPHTLSIRPLVFPSRETVEFRIKSPSSELVLTVDGQVTMEYRPRHTIRVRRAERGIDFVSVQDRSFYEVLRAKLRWGGSA